MPAHPHDAPLNALLARHEGSWRAGYAAFPAELARQGLKRGVEVGVAFGGHSEAILQVPCVEHLTGVDSYQHRPDYQDPMNLPQPVFDRLHQRTIDRLSVFGDRFAMIREASDRAAARFADGSLDFVYLDADHSEAGVFADLCAWAGKLRVGGLLAGHDYGHRDFPGVRRAVDRFVGRFGWQVHQGDAGVWWATRTALPISYFTPCYNCEPWIEQTAASVLEHNLREGDEYILVDDGSTDATAACLDRLARAHPAVLVIRHPSNRGGGAARNTAVAAAQHPLCFCLDADNLLLPRSVDPLVEHLLSTGADAVSFQTLRYFNDAANPHHTTHELSFDDTAFDLAKVLTTTRMPGASGNYLFTRESWRRAGGYPDHAGALDAWGLGFRQCATGSVLRVLPGSAYLHRFGHASYWTRHHRQGSVDADAFTIIQPYLDQLHPADARYLRSRRGQASWFTRLDQRPLRLKAAAGHDPHNDQPCKTPPAARLRDRLSRLLRAAA